MPRTLKDQGASITKASNANPIIAENCPQGVDAPVSWYTPQVATTLAKQKMSVPVGNVHLVTALPGLNAANARLMVKTFDQHLQTATLCY